MSEIYVDFDNITGGVTTPEAYDGQIECVSMRHAIDQQVVSTGGRKTGRSSHGPVELTHAIDRATPGLHAAAAGGANQGTVTITRVRSEGVAEIVTLSNVYVCRVDVETPLDATTLVPDQEQPLERFALEYSKIEWTYKYYTDKGFDSNVTGEYDVANPPTE